MKDKNWLEKINEIKKICIDAGLPIDVEKDSNPFGIDAILKLGDISFTVDSNFYIISLEVNIIVSVPEKNWQVLIERLMLLSQKLGKDVRYLLDGWARIEDDESNIKYQGNIKIPGRINADLLS